MTAKPPPNLMRRHKNASTSFILSEGLTFKSCDRSRRMRFALRLAILPDGCRSKRAGRPKNFVYEILSSASAKGGIVTVTITAHRSRTVLRRLRP